MKVFSPTPIFLTSLLSLCPAAFASFGGGHSGGGDVWACGKGSRGEYERIYLADTFEVFYKNKNGFATLNLGQEAPIIEASFKALAERDSALSNRARVALKRIKFENTARDTWLPEVPDDDLESKASRWSFREGFSVGIKNLRCEKRQLAVQYFGKSGLNVVKVQPTLFFFLTSFEKALFKFHEALVGAYGPQQSRAFIRKIVQQTVESSAFKKHLWNELYARTARAHFDRYAFKSLVASYFSCLNFNYTLKGKSVLANDLRSKFFFANSDNDNKTIDILHWLDFYGSVCGLNAESDNFDIRYLMSIYQQIPRCRASSLEITQDRIQRASHYRSEAGGMRNGVRANPSLGIRDRGLYLGDLAVQLGKILCP